MDEDAQEQAAEVRDLLLEGGIYAVLCDDHNPGVVSGTYEVRVPVAEAARAESILQADEAEAQTAPDFSHNMDLVTIYHGEGMTSEIEATGVKSVLDSLGIPAMIVGDSVLPNFPFEVRVPRDQEQAARAALAEAEASGSAAAEEAERLTERPL